MASLGARWTRPRPRSCSGSARARRCARVSSARSPGTGARSPHMRLLDGFRRRAEPRFVLAAMVALQLVAVLVFALATPHNGWLYFHGGDQLWYYGSAWLLGDGILPTSVVGYAWPVLLLPAGLIGGI